MNNLKKNKLKWEQLFLYEKDNIPSVYLIVYKDHMRYYIGCTKNIHSRIKSHINNNPHFEYKWIPTIARIKCSSIEEASVLEHMFIEKALKPRNFTYCLNRQNVPYIAKYKEQIQINKKDPIYSIIISQFNMFLNSFKEIYDIKM